MERSSLTMLVCDDDALCLQTLQLALSQEFHLICTDKAQEALALAERLQPDVVLLDIRLQSEKDGFAVLSRLRVMRPGLPIIIYSGMDDYAYVVQAMRLGASDYILKDGSVEKMRQHICQAVLQSRHKALAEALPRSQVNHEHLGEHPGEHGEQLGAVRTPFADDLIGESSVIVQLRSLVSRACRASGNVVITGESGVGKEIVARMLRRRSSSDILEPFVAVDSSTIQASTAESVLFGHERGAFTGADRPKKGLFEEAHGGIIYFDEISNMPLDIQAKLLRVLQEKEVVRLGASKSHPLNFRVVCATNRDLEELCRLGEFRFDLYTRLNVIPIGIPPLRQRRDDISLLASYFMDKYAGPHHTLTLAQETLDCLMAYAWPGNVRELENTIQYMITMHEGDEDDQDKDKIWLRDLPIKLQTLRENSRAAASPDPLLQSQSQSFRQQMESYARHILMRDYIRTGGNIKQMSEDLQIDRSNLYAKLTRYRIHEPKKR